VEEILAQAKVQYSHVERPRSEQEVQSIMARAHRDRLRVLPLGGGTCLGVPVLPGKVDLVLDMRGLASISQLDPRNLNMIVEAGKTIQSINQELAQVERGFMLPLDPPRSGEATLGGSYAANMSGPLRQLYGTLRDQALGVRGVSVEGKQVGFGGITVKNVSGYDLTKFLIGSAGSLCVVTRLALRILPIPETSGVCQLGFPRDRDLEGFLGELRQSVLVPSATVVRWEAGGADRAVTVGLEGHFRAVERQAREILGMASRHGGSGETLDGREALLERLGLAVDPRGPAHRTLAMRLGVPIAQGLKAAQAVEELAVQGSLKVDLALLGGNGVIFVYATDDSDEVLGEFAKGVREVALRMGGNVLPISGPRKPLEEWGSRMDPMLERHVVRPIKQSWDPQGVLLPVAP
jgi:FAD/FMN-containing dehydrogenase